VLAHDLPYFLSQLLSLCIFLYFFYFVNFILAILLFVLIKNKGKCLLRRELRFGLGDMKTVKRSYASVSLQSTDLEPSE